MQEINLRNYAYLGDAVWELFIREKTILVTNNAKKLHQLTTSMVKTQFQCELLHYLEPNLTEDETYYFTVSKTIDEEVLYKQKIMFSNIKVEPFYFLNDYIILSNINKKIDFLTISNEGNEVYDLDNQKLFADKKLLYVSIPTKARKFYGKYKMQVDRDDFASFFFSKSITQKHIERYI